MCIDFNLYQQFTQKIVSYSFMTWRYFQGYMGRCGPPFMWVVAELLALWGWGGVDGGTAESIPSRRDSHFNIGRFDMENRHPPPSCT